MTKQWNDLFALAREVAESVAAGATVDAERAWRLARAVLALDSDPAVTPHGSMGRRAEDGRADIVVPPRR